MLFKQFNFFEDKFLIMFFGLTLLIGALGFTPWVLASYGKFPVLLSGVLFLVGGGSPTFAAIIVSLIQCGKRGPGYLFGQFGRRGFSKIWFMAPFLLSFGIIAFSLGILSISERINYFVFQRLVVFIPVLVSAFLQNMWEEIGWRGYALPKLQERHSAFYSSVVVGVFWAVWHWPHFAVKDSVMATSYHNFFWFFVSVIVSSIIYSWLYNSAKGSLMVVTLYHSSFNAFGLLLLIEQGISYAAFPFLLLAELIMSIIIIAVFKFENLSRSKRVTFEQIIREG